MTRATEPYDVPDVAADAVVDPYWQDLVRPTSALSTSYLPATTGGPQPRWRKVSAIVLLVLITTTTAGGVCLTYGPGELFALLQRS